MATLQDLSYSQQQPVKYYGHKRRPYRKLAPKHGYD